MGTESSRKWTSVQVDYIQEALKLGELAAMGNAASSGDGRDTP